jgi:hypothetical protein
MKQVKVGLTGKQRRELERSAKKIGRSLSEEVRRRVDMSLLDEKFSPFAHEVAEEVKWLAQMVLVSALEKDQALLEPVTEDLKKIGPTVHRALVVALNEWFGSIRFGSRTEANPEADIIGKAAAKNYLLLATELRRRATEEEDEDEEAEGET